MKAATAGLVALLAPGAAFGQSKPGYDPDKALLGRASFMTHCAVCHGASARGDGPLAGQLRFAPPDLTRIAARNGGRFANDKVAKIIDGRAPMKGHGGTDMPVWGDAFKSSSEGYDDKGVKRKIDELVHHLASLQAMK